jgi:hypothetical protein
LRPFSRNIVETLICLILLGLIAALVLYPALIKGAAPVAADRILLSRPWQEAQPEGLQSPSHPYAYLQSARYYPWLKFIGDSTQRDDSLLWYPLEGCGMPFYALWRSRCLSPFTIPFYFMPPFAGLQLAAFLKLVLAGLCAFYAARRFGFALPLALFIGASFELSAALLLWLGWPLSDALPWLPLLLIFGERLALGQLRYWPLGSLVLALMLFGGSPETAAVSSIFLLVYLLLRMLYDRRGWKALLAAGGVLVVSILVGVALAAVQILPFIEFVGQASRNSNSETGGRLLISDLGVFFFPWLVLSGPSVVVRDASVAGFNLIGMLHAGLIPVLLLPLWFALRRYTPPLRRHRVESMLIAAALMTAAAYLTGWLGDRAPFLALLGPEHWLAANGLVLSWLAAAAAEEWLVLDPAGCKATIKRLLILGPVLVLLAAAALAARPHVPRPDAPSLGLQIGLTCFFAAALLALMIVTLLKPSGTLMGYTMSVLGCAELLLALHAGIPFANREHVFPRTQFVEALDEAGGRLGGTSRLQGWPLAGNSIAQAYAPSGIYLERARTYLEDALWRPRRSRNGTVSGLILGRDELAGPYAEIRADLTIAHVFPEGFVLARDTKAKPRAWLSYAATRNENGHPEPIDANTTPADPEKRALAAAEQDWEPAEIVNETNASVTISAHARTEAVLVLSDTWYPGWKATVDGAEAKVYPVDGLLRGVTVSEGRHTVVFNYEPRMLTTGLFASGAALLICVGGWLFPLLRPN